MNRAYPLGDWQLEVRDGDTRLGYEAWVSHKIESNVHVHVVFVSSKNSEMALLDLTDLDHRLCVVDGQCYALIEGKDWSCEARPGTFDLVNVHGSGHIRWKVKPGEVTSEEFKEIEEEATDYFGLTPAKPLLLDPTLGYIITLKRKSGPMLAKSYGVNRAVDLYLTREEAEEALQTMLLEASYEVLEVVVSSPETSHKELW